MASFPPSQKGLSLAGKAVFGSLCAGTFCLGVWQTQRYFEKQTLIAQREADLKAPPDTNITEATFREGSFRRLHLQGQYLHSAEFLVGPRSPPPGALPDKPGSSAQGMASAPLGYFVCTPFIPASAETRKYAPMIIINRGWVPRQMVVSERQTPQRRGAAGTNNGQLILRDWDRPTPDKGKDHVDVVVVPTKEESPRFLVAEHKMDERPPKMFWYDLQTMQRWIGWKSPEPVGLYAAVAPEETNLSKASWPVASPTKSIGNFKVEPAVHVGYAATWYGLSAAGLYMTRMMLTRGR